MQLKSTIEQLKTANERIEKLEKKVEGQENEISKLTYSWTWKWVKIAKKLYQLYKTGKADAKEG